MYFIVYFICIFSCTSCEEDKTSFNFEPASIIYKLYLYTCMWLYIWSCGHADIIYLTFNLRTVLGMGSNSAVGKNTSFCISCLQPWNNLANTMLNQRAILIYHLTWALKLTCRDILNLSLCNHYSRWMSWFESISYLQLHGNTCWLIF